MKFNTLLLRNLTFFWRTHLYTVLGAALGTAVLVGALMVGDSVRYSLRQMVFERLGKTEYVLQTHERYFRSQLAGTIAETLQTPVVPLLKTNGIAIAAGGQRRLNRVQVIGVDNRFGLMANNDPELFENLSYDEVIVNDRLADRLSLHAGDEILLRLQKLDYLPRDVPLALDSDLSLSIRLKIKAIAGEQEMGHFNLQTNQVVPNIAFVALSRLSLEMNMANNANILLIAERDKDPLTPEILKDVLMKSWLPEDAGIKLRYLADKQTVELSSQRIFLESAVVAAALDIDPLAKPVYTYFVNSIQSKDRITPYSFVAAGGVPLIPEGMNEQDIILNRWTAEDLQVKTGDSLSLAYYIPGPGRRLIEENRRFYLRKIVAIDGMYADRELMPAFPGLADQENCRDWQPGIPIDLDKIRPKDELYWDNFRGIPKAFISLDAAKDMWHNRFGEYTAIRFNTSGLNTIYQDLRQHLDPSSLGFGFRAVRSEGLQASAQSVDFAQLFIGLSFFIMIAALLLTGLLFVFSVEQRAGENGLYLALGLPSAYIKRLVFTEGAILAVTGGILGILFGIIYNQLIVYALKTLWIDAVGTSALRMYIDIKSVLSGMAGGVFLALLMMWLVMRKQIRQSIRVLQSGGSMEGEAGKFGPRVSAVVSTICVITVLFILIQTHAGRGREAAGAFFSAGFLLLVGCMALVHLILSLLSRKSSSKNLTLIKLGIRTITRRKKRALTLIGLLSAGLFIVFMVGANRHGAITDAALRRSGTGGFTFFAETALPVLYDLNSVEGKKFYGLEGLSSEIQVVPFRVKEGDDASCLNLNRVTQPQLLGLEAQQLARREAFTFSKLTDKNDNGSPWLLLNKPIGNVIPAIADETVIIWGLGKAVGDTLIYQDEAGANFKLKLVAGLANSVFQGNIIISNEALLRKYPSQSGYRLFLIDTPAQERDQVARQLNWSLQDLGVDIIPAAERLAVFNRVENTYLSIFLVLGGLGMILGTIGIGIVVLRSVAERRGELALLRAVGYGRNALDKLLLSEYFFILLAGILCGSFAALVAVLPAILSPGMVVPFKTIGMIFIAVLLSGLFWIYLAIRLAIRGDLLPALRNE
jgi:putative ABC transport system permease protein